MEPIQPLASLRGAPRGLALGHSWGEIPTWRSFLSGRVPIPLVSTGVRPGPPENPWKLLTTTYPATISPSWEM